MYLLKQDTISCLQATDKILVLQKKLLPYALSEKYDILYFFSDLVITKNKKYTIRNKSAGCGVPELNT